MRETVPGEFEVVKCAVAIRAEEGQAIMIVNDRVVGVYTGALVTDLPVVDPDIKRLPPPSGHTPIPTLKKPPTTAKVAKALAAFRKSLGLRDVYERAKAFADGFTSQEFSDRLQIARSDPARRQYVAGQLNRLVDRGIFSRTQKNQQQFLYRIAKPWPLDQS